MSERMCPCDCGRTYEDVIGVLMFSGPEFYNREQAEALIADAAARKGRVAPVVSAPSPRDVGEQRPAD